MQAAANARLVLPMECYPDGYYHRVSFFQHRAIRADFSGGQITSDAGLLPLRAFEERHSLTRSLAELLGDPRDEERVRHSALSLFRQRIYQIVAGYEDANDADRLRNDPAFQILADRPLGDALGSQPTLSRWENAPSARNLVRARIRETARCIHVHLATGWPWQSLFREVSLAFNTS